MKLDNLNEVLIPSDLIEVLPFSRNKIYRLLQTGEIKAKRVGTQYLILREDFFEYIGKSVDEKQL